MKRTPPQPKERRRWGKAKGICLDGPLARIGIGRQTEVGEEIRIAVEDEGKVARYLNVGPVPEVPPLDGVGLRFLGYVGERPTADPAILLGAQKRKGGTSGKT